MQVTLVSACRTFFGMKPGQTLQEFVTEFKQLTDKDKDDLKQEFAKIGIDATKSA